MIRAIILLICAVLALLFLVAGVVDGVQTKTAWLFEVSILCLALNTVRLYYPVFAEDRMTVTYHRRDMHVELVPDKK